MHVRHRQQIQRTGKQADAGEKTPPCHRWKRLALRQHEQHHRVDEMIKHRLFPDTGHSILREQLLQPVRAERTERHGQESRRGGDAGGSR